VVGEPTRAGREPEAIPEDALAELSLGATVLPEGGVRFRVWAPRARAVSLMLGGKPRAPVGMRPEDRGYFCADVPSAAPGDLYRYRLGGRLLPDPASRSQPEGVGGPSEVVDLGRFAWSDDDWRPPELARSAIYELHVGTFSDSGTFDGAIPELPGLAEVGITTVELLPVEEERAAIGWGYGPVFSFAVRQAYGGPTGLQRFVDAAHAAGLAVLLDVVYNHWSGQAAFLDRFGPYFHPRATTPWGPTPNFEGAGSDEVRRHFFECTRAWLREFHVDGFRLDAVHEVRDRADPPFWAELARVAHSEGERRARPVVLIAESDFNDTRILRPVVEGGWGLDAQWTDDFHHALHAALTGERGGYYVDYGPLATLARLFETPFWFQGSYARFNDRRRGAPVGSFRPDQFVAFDQNHDQVGNRSDGARLTTLLPGDLPRVALALVLWSPWVPMLFMGEEYGATTPFYFFTDPAFAAGAMLRRGRRRELRALGHPRPGPSPTARSTFERSHLDRSGADTPRGRSYRELVRTLLRFRRELPALRPGGRVEARAWEAERLVAVLRESRDGSAVLLANVGEGAAQVPAVDWTGRWTELLRSGSRSAPLEWQPGQSAPLRVDGRSFVILERTDR